jgi:hypothetical protein
VATARGACEARDCERGDWKVALRGATIARRGATRRGGCEVVLRGAALARRGHCEVVLRGAAAARRGDCEVVLRGAALARRGDCEAPVRLQRPRGACYAALAARDAAASSAAT